MLNQYMLMVLQFNAHVVFQLNVQDFPLPSLTGRRFNPMKSVGSRRASNKRTSKSFLRTITCLPLSEICERRGPGMKQIVIPRGKQREKLHNMGLIAKINILNKWTKVQLHDEIESLFRRCFIVDVGSKFSYEHLQIFPGSKVLTRPKASRNFNWDAQAVLSLHKSNLYILTAAPLKLLPNDDFAANIAGNENVALQDKCSETYQQVLNFVCLFLLDAKALIFVFLEMWREHGLYA